MLQEEAVTMTLTELKERIKEEVVLHEGDLKEWQWRRNGLLTEAEQDGISSAEFMRLVNDVSYQLGGLFPKINALKATAESYARADKKKLHPIHIDEIVTEAERLTLSREFVTQRWLPAILAAIPDPPKTDVESAVTAPSPVSAPVVNPVLSREEVRQQIASRLDMYKSESTIPSWALRALLETIKADESVVTEEIFSYLVNNLYKAVKEPQGNTLRERLVSSDWQNVLYRANQEPAPVPEPYRPEPVPAINEPQPVVRSFTAQPARVYRGEPVTLSWEVENLLAVTIDDLGTGLSPQNRGWVKPTKTTDYTLFDVNNNPLSTVRVEVIPRDRSGVYGVLFALALLAIIYWFIKGNTSRSEKDERPEPKAKTEQTTTRKRTSSTYGNRKQSRSSEPDPDVATDKREPKSNASETVATNTQKKEETTSSKPKEEKVPREPETSKPSAPADARSGKYEEAFGNKPYDKVELGIDEQGWRRARSHGRWGFINEFDEWVIEPEYEAVTPFRGNTASVFLNGKLMTINRAGELVSK
ncbi:hypothetical protein GCM10028806_15840 [Spirosoma terrae]|nr:WG repeat-containing protein [Spirosoma terrae]